MIVYHLPEGTFHEEERYDGLQARRKVRHRSTPSRLSSDSATASPEPVWPKGETLQLPTPTPCSLHPRGVTRERLSMTARPTGQLANPGRTPPCRISLDRSAAVVLSTSQHGLAMRRRTTR